MSEPVANLLARGPWDPSGVSATWLDDHYQPTPEQTEAADAEMAKLAGRGSPSHDGLAARLVDWTVDDGTLSMTL